jgi:putative phosphoribosyl transferase
VDTTTSESNGNGHLIAVSGGAVILLGRLGIPENPHGIVLLASERGSDQYAPIAQLFQEARLATLVVDLLTAEDKALDSETGFFRDNVDVLHQRTIGIANWLIETPQTQNLRICYFGVNVAGAAALVAAAERPDAVVAVASAMTRFDLARDYLPRVHAPTLLFADADNTSDIDMNRGALGQIESEERNRRLETIQGIANLFKHANVQQAVVQLASEWFVYHLGFG